MLAAGTVIIDAIIVMSAGKSNKGCQMTLAVTNTPTAQSAAVWLLETVPE